MQLDLIKGMHGFCKMLPFFLLQVYGGLVNMQNVLAVMFTLFSYDVCQVVTFWEGEIVDGKNYTFFTGKWEASYVS